MPSFAALVRRRLARERGRADKQAPFMVALGYPTPYRAAMSGLGAQQIYRTIQAEPGMACERVFLPDDARGGLLDAAPRSYEALRPMGDFSAVALTVAYELEIAGVVQLLEAAGLGALGEQRQSGPLVIAGGPLSRANPVPLAPFVDAIAVGDGDELAVGMLRIIREAPDRSAALDRLAEMPHVLVPARNESLPSAPARCPDELLPAWAPIRTPEAALSDMFLIEAGRGCSRRCAYCVMRRSAHGGVRQVPSARILELVPPEAERVGLVGAAVGEHPEIRPLLRQLAARGKEVGLSSLRPDRLDDELVAALKEAGNRTLTVAADGPSERLRREVHRHVRAEHVLHAAELVARHGLARLKLYLMLGLPEETDADIDECIGLVLEASRIAPVALGLSPFCPKRGTPLEDQPFFGIAAIEASLDRLRRGLRGRAAMRSTSARWAWVEHQLAQGGPAAGRAVHRAVLGGGSFAAYRRAFESGGGKRAAALPERPR